LATTLAGSAPGSKRRGSLRIGTGGVAGDGLGVTTAAAVLLAAANRARILSAIAESLSPIFSIFLKISPVCLDPEKLSKMRNGSQKLTVRGRKIYTDICGFYTMLTGGFS
jgi:hypothetical protein